MSKSRIAIVILVFLVLSWLYYVFLTGSPARPGIPLFEPNVAANHVVHPLDDNGDVDYVAVWNESASKDISPEQNVLAGLVEVLGAGFFDDVDKLPDDFFWLLGVERPTANSDSFFWGNWTAKSLNEADFRSRYEIPTGAPEGFSQLYWYATENPWSDCPELESWLEATKLQRDQVREALEREGYFCPIVVSNEDDSQLMYSFEFVVLRNLMRVLQVACNKEIGDGNFEGAFDQVQQMFHLSDALGQDGLIVDRLVAQMLEGIAISQASAFILQTLKDLLANRDPYLPLSQLMGERERYFVLDSMQKFVRASNSNIYCDAETAMRELNATYNRVESELEGLDVRDQYLATQILVKDLVDDSIDLMDMPGAFERRLRGRREMGRQLAAAYRNGAVGLLENVAKAELATTCRRNLLRVTIELEKYRKLEGTYPVSLDKIAKPETGEPLTIDPINASPFVYKVVEDEKYLLYSIGFNQIDDGGLNADDHPEYDDWRASPPEPKTWQEYLEELREFYPN